MQFDVKALKGRSDATLLTLEATDADDARNQAARSGYTIISITPRGVDLKRIIARRPVFPLAMFSQELLALLQAGLNLVEAISALAEKEQRHEIKRILDGLLLNLREGRTLSASLEQFPRVFPPLYIATVRSSERTGNMHDALSRYIAYQAQVDILKKKIISASIYPLLLIAVGGLVMIFLMGYVVPKFSGIYESSGQDIPWLSQLLLDWGRLIQSHGKAAFMALLAVGLIATYAASRTEVRGWGLRQLWRIPSVGERMRVYQLARFYRTVGMLLRGGIPVVTALEMVSGLLQPALRAQLASATTHIRNGRSISESLEMEGLSTPVAQRLLLVGERTGDMGEMMERIASFYDDEMARWVDCFTRIFEPALMAVIGLIIGLIVVLMYLPIFELAGNIQ
jgi:general secretion pathway protein F